MARSGTQRRRTRLVVGLAVLLGGAGLWAAPGALADGPTTFSTTTAIAIPAAGSPDQIGPASPYPSTVAVSGLAGTVSAVTVTLSGLTHSAVNDVDALLVAPTGENLVVLSDVGDPSILAFANNAALTFSDAAAGAVPPGNIPTGTYLPTNNGAVDTFPAPAPAPSSQTTLAGAFSGIAPNGTWQLFVVDDTTGDVGSLAGGWSLTVTTSAADVATTTTVTTSATPSTTGSSVTFTATVTAGGSPVTTGTVRFADGVVALGAPVPLDGSGRATLSTSALAEGTHQVRATYGGATGFLTSNGTVSQRVDNLTVVTGTTFCNTGPLTVPTVGPAQPYPSNITVSGLSGTVVAVVATLNGLTHQVPVDLDVLLSGPVPSTNVVLLSDAGGTSPVSGLTVAFDDAAAGAVPTPLVGGTFRPSNVDSPDTFPAPAPGLSAATALSTFVGADPNGTWSLWVVDDATGDSGSISGGWCLTVTASTPTTTTLTSASNPSTVGQPVTFTATVTAAGTPATAGSVQFADGATALGGPVPVASDGTATLTTSALTAGTHAMTATYAGATGFATSSGALSQVVNQAATTTALTSSVNPAAPAQAVTFTATVTSSAGPVATGTVTFSDGGTALGAPVPVDASGQATFTTSTLTSGTHTILAEYGGDATSAPSSASLTQDVGLVADAGGPYTVAEGGSLTLDGSGSTPGATYGWDLDGDADFTDATGVSPTLTWADLQALGIDDGPATWSVAVQVTLGAVTATSATTLDVTNTAPTTVLTGALTANVGEPFTIEVGADDPSAADMAAGFTYTVDWGDGSPVLVVFGPADPPVTHTYTAAGSYAAAFTATDKDGGSGEPTGVQVVAAAAPVPTPTPTPMPAHSPSPSPSIGAQLSASGADAGTPATLGLVLVLSGALLVLASGRHRV
jgi:subtilisin-like proprotein convertase family protein